MTMDVTVTEAIAYDCGFRAGHAHAAGLLEALEGLVDALAANDEDGMTEFADVMVNARRAIAAAKGGRDAG